MEKRGPMVYAQNRQMMSNSPSAEASNAHLVGTRPGSVKNLLGFRKGVHKIPAILPDNMYERQFAGICAPDIEKLGLELFEKLRTARGYKRKEINLAVNSPDATITTSDFILDLSYAPDPADPGDYQLTYDLHNIRDITIFADGSLDAVFSGVFNRVSFTFARAITVADLIDELEEKPGVSAGLRYPPDCGEVVMQLPGLIGQVRVTSRELEVVSPAGTSPAGLVKSFVGASEVLSANPSLEKLIPRRR